MRKQILLSGAAAIAVSAFSVPAFAADPMPIVMAPTTVATYVEAAPRTWTGGYVGGHAAIVRGAATDGMTCILDDVDVPVFFITEEPFDDLDPFGPCDWNAVAGALDDPFGDDFGANDYFENEIYDGLDDFRGYMIGAQIGYLRQLGNGPNGFVIGGEVAAGLTSVQDTLGADLLDFTVPVQGIFEMNALATATLRAGFAFGPALIYAEAGLALGVFSYTDTLGFSDTDTAHGFVWGAGIEGRISEHVTLFFEYNRVRINEVQLLSTDLILFPTLVDVDTRFNVFKTGFNIQFGGDH